MRGIGFDLRCRIEFGPGQQRVLWSGGARVVGDGAGYGEQDRGADGVREG